MACNRPDSNLQRSKLGPKFQTHAGASVSEAKKLRQAQGKARASPAVAAGDIVAAIPP